MSSERDREARILIVDDQRDVARVLRVSLDLLNRGYIITDMPSGEEALLEIPRTKFDILVADFRLPGMNGVELIRRARKHIPELPAILITGGTLGQIESALKETGIEVSDIFEKPIDTSAFTAAVEKAIFGEGIAARPLSTTDIQLGPLPTLDRSSVSNVLSSLIVDLGANAVIFVSRAGEVLIREGLLDDTLRFSELAVLLAHNFTTTAEIATYLGDIPPTAVHYYEGNRHDIYALAVGVHFFLVIVFPGGSQKQMGPVLRFGRGAVQKIIGAIGKEALGIAKPAVIMEEGQVAAEEVVEGAAEMPVEVVPKREAPQPALELNMDDLDMGELDSGIDDLDGFWEEAAANVPSDDDDTISFDQAVELGILPEELE